LVATLFIGAEIKGARRWISIGGFSLQTSEFMKPFFAVLSAWALSQQKIFLSFILLSCPVCLFIMQPDLGMTIVTVLIWVAQLFIMGLPFIVFGLLIALGFCGFFCAYLFLPHVTSRVHQFTQGSDPTGDMFQVFQSLKAFKLGGIFGKGPGEGVVKYNIPDVHADFVFAVIGEEFGFVVCLFILSLFFFIIIRSLLKVSTSTNLFSILAISGLIVQFGLQTFINIASSIHIIPTKGMTRPFLSYGGSSCLSISIAMGMLLALTRKKHGVIDYV
jgi:cell division protein FtsW